MRAEPRHLIARLNLVEALVGVGKKEEAIAEARRALKVAGQSPSPPTPFQG
jgi:hypothetical protein